MTGKIATGTDIFVDHQTFFGVVTSYGRYPATGTVAFLDAADNQHPFASASLNTADPVFLFRTVATAGLGESSVQVGDFNGDGVPDMIAASANSTASCSEIH